MKKKDVKSLKSGMITAEDIVTKHGQVIAPRDTVIGDSLIARLRFYGIASIAIQDDEPIGYAPAPLETDLVEAPEPKAPVASPVVDTTSYTEKLKKTPVFQQFQMDYANVLADLQNTLDKVLRGEVNDLNLDALVDEASALFASKTTIQLFDIIHGMKGSDDSVYVHSLNVALIARCIAKWLRMTKKQMDNVLLAGLLHDIGKLRIPEEVLNKEGQLSDAEYEMIRGHALEGRKLLNTIPDLDRHIVNASSQHHERYDGSGYPRGLATEEIDDYAMILAIADVYDAMTAVRSYREPLCAFQVIEAFEEDGLQKYKPQIILTFLERVAATYQNSIVQLNDGVSGKIIFINPGRLSRPVVQLEDGSVIDLSRTSGKFIKNVL